VNTSSLEVVAGCDLAQVKLDPIQFDQVLLNLAVNARDAMPRGGRIIIETANIVVEGANTSHGLTMLPGSYVVLSFSDDGEGIDSATLHRIFEPFYTTKEMGRGTGLGLATVHGIVKQLGGYIFVYSEKGKGTTFKIYLPAVSSEGERILRVPSLEEPQGGTETILVAEDEDAILRLVDRVLSKMGYTVLTANSGAAALELASNHPGRIDLLLTDVLMPNMIGPELAEQISTKRPEIKVLYMSGYTDETVVRFGVLNSTVNYIAKPFSPDKMARRVREVLGVAPQKGS
jgi:two-component system cell cycle sensor histidine kinase/response regulator CckA